MKKRTVLLTLFILAAGFGVSGQNADINLLKSINGYDPASGPWHTVSSTAFALDAGVPAGLFLYGLLKKDSPTRQKALQTGESLLVSIALAEVAKYTVNRTRPYIAYPASVHAYETSETGFSFPSGHTSFAFAMATSLSLQYRKWYVTVPAMAWASAVGYSRLYLGEHYPSDVLAGAALGAASAFITRWTNRRLAGKHPN